MRRRSKKIDGDVTGQSTTSTPWKFDGATVTFPAAERPRLLTGTKLYCLVTGTCAKTGNNLPKVVT